MFTIKSPYTSLGENKDTDDAYETYRTYDEARSRGYWTLDEFPDLADWLTENSDGLDALAEAVRKPAFCVPKVREHEKSPMHEALNVNTFSQFREYARAAGGRAYYRIGIGDIDGAIEDTLTVYHLGRHVAKQGMLIDYLVGIAIEGLAHNIGIAGNPDHPPTKAQLEHFLGNGIGFLLQ
jgi:hypothetical protein